MKYQSFNLTEAGASHIKNKKECQDYSISYTGESISIAIVCDGHGGDDYIRSAIGSKLASAVAYKNLLKFLSDIKIGTIRENPQKVFEQLESSIINGWNEAIYTHLKDNPFTEEELNQVSEKAKKIYKKGEKIESAYGTTLIAIGMTDSFWIGIQIGDGKCVSISKDSIFSQPIPWDDACFLNATTSMCDSNALHHFRYSYSEELPAAIFIGTDGVDDCFQNDEQLNGLYKTIIYSFGSCEWEEAIAELKDYLPRLTAKGSGDDISIAAIMDLDYLEELDIFKEMYEKNNIEEKSLIE